MKMVNKDSMYGKIIGGGALILLGVGCIAEPWIEGYGGFLDYLVAVMIIATGIILMYFGLEWYKNNGREKIIVAFLVGVFIVIDGGYWLYYNYIDKDYLLCELSSNKIVKFEYKKDTLFSVYYDNVEVNNYELALFKALWTQNSPNAAEKMKDYLEIENECWYN